MSNIKQIEISEIINQKKQFIFDVEQSSEYVFPNEEYTYYIYIKNISGVKIENFKIKIDNPREVTFEEINPQISQSISLEKDEVKLYTLKASCRSVGKYIVNFIGLGNETEILFESLTINCNYNNNQNTLTHRIQIYDFSPYESNYTMEADNYSEEVTQTFKRQKLPYKAGEQPFPLNSQVKLDSNNKPYNAWKTENIESQSFIDQYNEAKNTKEHVYQYISRENFSEEAAEVFTGKNLQELARHINENSTYFNAKFIRGGNNELLTDFNRYAPNGFLYRMGLLSSELYHNLGVIPTYTYMSDYLFRWAPSEAQPLNLYPKKKGMKWNENIWAGKGWIVYRTVTQEYKQTDEFKKLYDDKKIDLWVYLDHFEDKKLAEEYIEKLQYFDSIDRAEQKSDIIKFEYILRESYYDTGVFFVNIPIDKIPKNFYLLKTKDIYDIINRAKPYGAKPLIRYSYETIFNHNFDINLQLGYFENILYQLNSSLMYKIDQKKIGYVSQECGNKTLQFIKEYVDRTCIYDEDLFDFNSDLELNVEKYPELDNSFSLDVEEDFSVHQFVPHCELVTVDNIIPILYQKNYNRIGFYLQKNDVVQTISYRKQEKDNSTFSKTPTLISIPIYKRKLFNKGDIELGIKIFESKDKYYTISTKHDTNTSLDYIKSIITNNYKKYDEKIGMQTINSLIACIYPTENKQLAIFFISDKDGNWHYFNHIIIQNLQSIKLFIDNVDNEEKEGFYKTAKVGIYDNLKDIKINLETPFCYEYKAYQPTFIKGGENWNDLERINTKDNTFSYIKNLIKKSVIPNDIILYYNDFDIPKTAIIKQIKFKILTESTNKNIYLDNAINLNHITTEVIENDLQLLPNKIEITPVNRESPTYYQYKLENILQNGQDNFTEKYQSLLNEAQYFDDEVLIQTSDYLDYPNDYINIKKPFWYELSEFTDEKYNLNETNSIKLVIEGYNEGAETKIIGQVLSELNFSTQVDDIIPSGYFNKEINLLYPNSFVTNTLRVRFRFEELNHNIKIFNTAININFKEKQKHDAEWEFIDTAQSSQNVSEFELYNNYYNPMDFNNGFGIKLSFDELTQGEYYNIYLTELEVIYENTDINILVNKDKYYYNYLENNETSITGKQFGYLSGECYNDYVSMGQPKSNIGLNNNGIKLKDTLYQAFSTRADNITSIELFPNGFYGTPGEELKIGLYKNHGKTPGKLIKEIYANGWVKNNSELRNLPSIKYNFNIDELKVNETYWIKIEILNPKDDSYYLLESINEEQDEFKLLSKENNNYINTFSCLKFNICSKNNSRTFNHIPYEQEVFDNPYTQIGLHKNQGTISNLRINKKAD